jgi:hypothetical protein
LTTSQVNQSITWKYSSDKVNSYNLGSGSNIQYSDNGSVLILTMLSHNDMRYYSCGFNSTVISEFYLIVIKTPKFSIYIFDSTGKYGLIDSNKAIVLFKNSSNNPTYVFYRSDSYPDVNLTFYDTNSMNPLQTYYQSKYCSNEECYNYLYFYFSNLAKNTTSLTLSAYGSNSQYSLINSMSIDIFYLQSDPAVIRAGSDDTQP